jgi:hypothetical protein
MDLMTKKEDRQKEYEKIKHDNIHYCQYQNINFIKYNDESSHERKIIVEKCKCFIGILVNATFTGSNFFTSSKEGLIQHYTIKTTLIIDNNPVIFVGMDSVKIETSMKSQNRIIFLTNGKASFYHSEKDKSRSIILKKIQQLQIEGKLYLFIK